MKDKELIRLCTAGSVDDGKSTLIGRLLFDTDQVYEDQMAAIKRVSEDPDNPDLSLLTDGLASEREQKITIDVAYRYFSTKKRRFIVADVPGHEQYTKNMVTGASQAQVGLILIDARKGLLIQSKRHLFVASLLRVPHIAIVINKMDLVDYSEDIFEKIKSDVLKFSAKLEIPDLQFIPASAFKGDMVVDRGDNLPWYSGRTVVDYLNSVEVESDRNLIDFRLPVQYVMRPDQDTRVYAGIIESGVIRKGEEVMILPSEQTTTVTDIHVGFNEVEEATHPHSVAIQLAEERDINRGDIIVRPNNVPHVGNSFEAIISWFDAKVLQEGKRYIIKHTTNETFGIIKEIRYELNIDTLHRKKGVVELAENGIAKVHIVTHDPVFYDLYKNNRNTGNFIIIDPDTFYTAGAGVITASREQHDLKQESGVVYWFTGLSGSGKSTLADAFAQKLKDEGNSIIRLDGDTLRDNSFVELGFDERERKINVDKAAFAAKIASEQGHIVVASFISPYKDQREWMKKNIMNFKEIYVSTPLSICEERDVKGLYKKARAGEISQFTGISHDYEVPDESSCTIDTAQTDVDECIERIYTTFFKNDV